MARTYKDYSDKRSDWVKAARRRRRSREKQQIRRGDYPELDAKGREKGR